MKKSTLKTYLILLLVFLLSISLMLTAFACKKTNTETEEPAETSDDFTSLFSNGNFSSFTSDTAQPYSPSSWESYTPSGYSADNKVAGIIDTGADYDENRSVWGDLPNPYGEVTDNKVLMIYNKEENLFGYTNKFTASAKAYYSISFKVKVVNVDAENGASVRISTENGFSEFTNINATNEFVTYTFYMQAPAKDAAEVTIRLALGYDDHKVKGYAFFDDVVATKITKADYDAATAGDTVKIISMLYPDGEFNYYSYSSSSTTIQSPASWAWNNGANVAGKSVPTSDLYKGVISTSDWEAVAESYGENPGLPVENSADTYLMAIIKKQSSSKYSPTAGYYASNSSIVIDRATLYEISVWVKAIVSEESDADKGARVVLKGSDTYESAVVNTTDKKDVNNGWAKVTFYVLGNQFRSQDFTIQLWIGNDKANNTLTQGNVYFDKLTISEVNVGEMNRSDIVATYSAKEGTFNPGYLSYVKFIDLKTEDEKLIHNDNFTNLDENGLPTTLTIEPAEGVIANDTDVIKKVIPYEDLTGENVDWKTKYGIDANPLYPYTFSPVLIVNNTIPCAYTLKTNDLFEIKQSISYRISVWIKTIGLEDGKNITLKLVDDKDSDIDSASFTINTSSYENEQTNNYVEYSFYLTGEMPTSANGTARSNYVRIVVTNGSGSQTDPSSFQKGAFVIANINMEQITYTEYSSHSSSGTYSKSKDYAENSGTITNGNFNSYDRKDTTFGDDGFVAMTDKDGNENLTGAVSGWTNNVGKKYGTKKIDGEDLPDYPITKADDNTSNTFIAAIQGKTITTIRLIGPNDYDKTFETESEWKDIFDIDTISGKFSWKSGNSLENGDYTVKIKVDEKELNDLIAGIINVNASNAYLAQFGLTAAMIYDQWSEGTPAETVAKSLTFGAPNLLMITTRQGTYPAGSIKLKNTYVKDKATNDMTDTPALKSSTASLNGSSYYHFKCYGKAINGAIGEVYVTTSSADAKVTSYTVDKEDGWVEYNFYVETGLSSVSATFEIYYGKKGDGDTAYSGTLLFDSFSYVEIDEEEYAATPASERSTFTTITFDNLSASEKAVAPSGFSATNSTSSNSDTQVSGIIARENYAYTSSDGKTNNLGIYTTTTKEENGETVTEEVVLPESALSATYIFSDEGMEDGATVGDYLLMINNRKDTYQAYYLSSLSLASETCYKFTAYVRTAKIEKDKHAKVYVKIDDEPMTFEVNTEYDENGELIVDGDGNALNKWKKVTFYFKNTKSTSVSASIYFELGKSDDDSKMKGYLFIDNVSLSKITEDEYNAGTADYEVYEKDDEGNDVLDANGEKVLTAASKAYRLSNKVTVLKEVENTDTDEDDGDEEEEQPKSSLNTTLLWTYITSIAIAVVLIAVIVVWLIRKYRRPKTAAPGERQKADYDRTKTPEPTEDPTKNAGGTGSARDEFRD